MRNPEAWLDRLDVKVHVYRLLDELRSKGATINVPEKDRETAIEKTLNMMRIRHMVAEKEGRFKVNPDMQDILTYYANTLENWN